MALVDKSGSRDPSQYPLAYRGQTFAPMEHRCADRNKRLLHRHRKLVLGGWSECEDTVPGLDSLFQVRGIEMHTNAFL